MSQSGIILNLTSLQEKMTNAIRMFLKDVQVFDKPLPCMELHAETWMNADACPLGKVTACLSESPT